MPRRNYRKGPGRNREELTSRAMEYERTMMRRLRAKRYDFKWDDMLSAQRVLRGLSSEGFVVHFHKSGLRLKVKTDDYTRLRRLVCALSTRAVWEVLSTGASLDEFLEAVPDEFMEWVKAKAGGLRAEFGRIQMESEELIAELSGDHNPSRKQMAEKIKERAEHPAVCFKMLDHRAGKKGDYAPVIWKLLYPAHETFRTVNEDVA